MPQLLLLPDPRPLVERLGADFFRRAPLSPGVYLMRDGGENVLYVGKAKSLRKRLASYRVANPDRLPRRHLRLLRAVERIEFETCSDEAAALAREAELLRTLRPRFNRAGTWPGPKRYLGWRLAEDGLSLAITSAPVEEWNSCGPMGVGAFHLRAALLRLLWSALHLGKGLAGMPHGWFHGTCLETICLPRLQTAADHFERAKASLDALFEGNSEGFCNWIRELPASQFSPFDSAVWEADLESISEFATRLTTQHRSG